MPFAQIEDDPRRLERGVEDVAPAAVPDGGDVIALPRQRVDVIAGPTARIRAVEVLQGGDVVENPRTRPARRAGMRVVGHEGELPDGKSGVSGRSVRERV